MEWTLVVRFHLLIFGSYNYAIISVNVLNSLLEYCLIVFGAKTDVKLKCTSKGALNSAHFDVSCKTVVPLIQYKVAITSFPPYVIIIVMFLTVARLRVTSAACLG